MFSNSFMYALPVSFASPKAVKRMLAARL